MPTTARKTGATVPQKKRTSKLFPGNERMIDDLEKLGKPKQKPFSMGKLPSDMTEAQASKKGGLPIIKKAAGEYEAELREKKRAASKKLRAAERAYRKKK